MPEETVYPPGRSEEETRDANRQAFLTSEEAAEAAALAELDYPAKVVVRGLSEGSPAEGRRISRMSSPPWASATSAWTR